MGARPRAGSVILRALWLCGVLALLAGIVAMHGLNTHAGAMAPSAHGLVTHEPTGPAADVGRAHGAHEDVSPADITRVTSDPGGLPGGHDGMVAMCVAVLVVALGVVLRMLDRRLAGALLRVSVPSLDRLVLARRDRDPPSLTRLSIRRC